MASEDFSTLESLEEVTEAIEEQMLAFGNDVGRVIGSGNKSAARRCRKALQNLSKLKKPFKDMTLNL